MIHSHVGLLPPKIKALIGTPSGLSQASSMIGHCDAGAVNLELGWAAFVCAPGFQGLPSQSVMRQLCKITHRPDCS